MKVIASNGRGFRPRCIGRHLLVLSRDPAEDTPYSRNILRELIVRDAVVPEIWAFEIANNIFVSHRKRKRIDEQQIAEYLRLLKALPIRCETQPLWTNVALESVARQWDIAAYDASYLALASRKRIPLATFDNLLKRKAMEEEIEIIG